MGCVGMEKTHNRDGWGCSSMVLQFADLTCWDKFPFTPLVSPQHLLQDLYAHYPTRLSLFQTDELLAIHEDLFRMRIETIQNGYTAFGSCPRSNYVTPYLLH